MLVASVSATLSLLLIDYPEHFGGVAILLTPGIVVGMIVGDNVHDFNPWVVALANFAVYFGASCVAWQIWKRYLLAKDRVRR